MNPAARQTARRPITARKRCQTARTKNTNNNGHYSETDQSHTDRVRIQKQCGKAPAAKAGGKRRRFSGSKESLVRKIAEKCNALLKCDIATSGKSDATVLGVQDTLCDTGSQAGVCGTGFAEKYGLVVDSNCTTRLTDASGNEMSVTGCTTVWL